MCVICHMTNTFCTRSSRPILFKYKSQVFYYFSLSERHPPYVQSTLLGTSSRQHESNGVDHQTSLLVRGVPLHPFRSSQVDDCRVRSITILNLQLQSKSSLCRLKSSFPTSDFLPWLLFFFIAVAHKIYFCYLGLC